MLLEKSHWVHIVVDGHILVVAAISIVDRLSGIAHDGLAIDLRTCRIHRSVLMPVFDKIKGYLHLVVEEPMSQVACEVHFVAIGIDEHTLLITISKVGTVGSRIVAATDSEVVVMRKGRARDSIEPVCVIAFILEVGLTGTYVTAVHHVELIAETGERQITRVVDRGLGVALSIFCRDDDHTGSTTGTIDSSSGSILQHVDRGNVLRSHCAQATLDAIDKHQWRVVATQRKHTTQTNG